MHSPHSHAATDRRPWGLLTAALCALAAFISLYTMGNLRFHLVRYFAVISMAMALMLLAYRAWELIAGDDERRAVWLVIGAAIVFRLALVGLSPTLSDDLWRYAWDGRVMAHGFNPYAHLPNDPDLSSLRNEAYTHIAYKDYHSIYPPVIECGVAVAAWLSEEFCGASVRVTFVIWKIFLCAAELGTLLLMMRLLALWKIPARRLVLYAWNPVAIIEFGGQGHGDAFMSFFLMLCVYGVARTYRSAVVGGFAAAILSRAVPIIYAPLLMRAAGFKKIALGVVLATLCTAPFISVSATIGVWDSVTKMGSVFVFNGFGFWTIYTVLEAIRAWTLEPYITAFLACLFFIGLVIYSVRARLANAADLPRAMLGVCTLFALLIWNMHPWYFTWGLSLAPFVASWAWLWISFIAQFTYVHYTPQSDAALQVVFLIEYLGFIGLLLLQRRWGRAIADR